MKQVYMCEGCGTHYTSKEFAEECEEIHNAKIENMSVVAIRFVSHRPEIRAICVQYDRELVGVDHVEKVWFYAK